ncbi:hypothetical protein D3C75_891630 [compost metagenome]
MYSDYSGLSGIGVTGEACAFDGLTVHFFNSVGFYNIAGFSLQNDFLTPRRYGRTDNVFICSR